MHASPPRSRLVASDSGWCLRANRICARRGTLRYFASISRLGDGAFWYALMAGLLIFDGMAGLRACRERMHCRRDSFLVCQRRTGVLLDQPARQHQQNRRL